VVAAASLGLAVASFSSPAGCASVKEDLELIKSELIEIKHAMRSKVRLPKWPCPVTTRCERRAHDLLVAFRQAAESARPPVAKWATCSLGPNGKPCDGKAQKGCVTVTGRVLIQEKEDGSVRISYRIEGLTPGKHGFHIHEKADFSQGCVSAGPHYNPHAMTHGGPDSSERHGGTR